MGVEYKCSSSINTLSMVEDINNNFEKACAQVQIQNGVESSLGGGGAVGRAG